METPNIYTAINAVMTQVGYVKKQSSPNLKYTYAGEAALINALRPEMVEQGIVAFVDSVNDVVTREYKSASGSAMVNTTLTARFRFVHAPSQTEIFVTARGEGMDTGDKSNNKAMTCAYKYALRQTFMIETGDDPDNFQPAPRQSTQEPQATTPPPAEQHEPNTPAAPVAVDPYEAACKVMYKGKAIGEGITDGLKKFRAKFETDRDEGKLITPEYYEAYEAAGVVINHREGTA